MVFDGQTITVLELADGIFELRFDRKGESVNKLDRLAFSELVAALGALAARPRVAGVLATSAKDAFIVGADIFEFIDVFSAGEKAVETFVAANARIVTSFAEFPAPTVAAVNGLALGGGLEIALAADYRVLAETARIGVPEVHLGIFPGYGGTARLPRLIGLAESADWIISGDHWSAREALEQGAADATAAPDDLFETALALLKQAIANPGEWRARRLDGDKPLDLPEGKAGELLAAAKIRAARSLPHYPAAEDAVQLLEEAAPLSCAEALALEAKRFASTARTQAAASLVGNFVNEQALKKSARALTRAASPVRKAAVLGAGVMGAGIAYQSALKGVPALLKDVSAKALGAGVERIEALLAKQVERGRLKQLRADAVMAAITPTESFDGFGDVDVAIEAIVEDAEAKQALYRQVEAAAGATAILASNTSSLRIADLARGVSRPQNFVGMHFFNPVPAMALVEVVRGPQTSEAALAAVVGYASAMGKTPVVVGDCPGFVVNRVLTPYLIAFLQLVREGADYREIDRVMEAFGWPMGPAWLADVIGLDITQHVVEIVSAGFPGRLACPTPGAVELLKADGRLGQKNGRGFYLYAEDARGLPTRTADAAVVDLLKSARSGAPAALSDEDVRARMMIPMILEAARCYEEGAAATPGEVDMCLILGLGLPRYLGGALRYADWMGLRKVAATAKRWEGAGDIYRPSEAFLARAEKGGGFYG